MFMKHYHFRRLDAYQSLACILSSMVSEDDRAWLASHPASTELWLLARLADGFRVCRVEGVPVLVYGSDHAALLAQPPTTKAKFDRNTYQREYMRKRRAGKARSS